MMIIIIIILIIKLPFSTIEILENPIPEPEMACDFLFYFFLSLSKFFFFFFFFIPFFFCFTIMKFTGLEENRKWTNRSAPFSLGEVFFSFLFTRQRL